MSSIKQNLKKTLTIIAILSIGIFCYQQPNTLIYILSYQWHYLVIICALYVLFYLLNAGVLLLIILPHGSNIEFIKVIGVNQLSSFLNYMLPFRVASIGVKMLLLKRLFGVSPGATIGTFTLSTVAFLLVCLITVFCTSAFVQLPQQKLLYFREGSLIVFFVVMLFLTLLMIEKKLQLLNNIKLPQALLDLKNSLLTANYKILIVISALYIIQVFLAGFMTYILFLGANTQVSFALCLLMTTVGSVSGLLALTPANVGVKEVSYVGIGSLFAIPADIIVAILLIDRLIQVSLLTMGLPLFSDLKQNE